MTLTLSDSHPLSAHFDEVIACNRTDPPTAPKPVNLKAYINIQQYMPCWTPRKTPNKSQ